MQNPKRMPINNGAIYDNYIWTQNQQTLELYIFLLAPCTKKDIKVRFTSTKLSVVVSGIVLLEGQFQDIINVDQSIWLIEEGKIQDYEGKHIHCILQKFKNNPNKWWSTPIKGHAEIDTNKIIDEPNHTDNNNVSLLPTIDYLKGDMVLKDKYMSKQWQAQKSQKLKAFFDAHPELDFSKCKF